MSVVFRKSMYAVLLNISAQRVRAMRTLLRTCDIHSPSFRIVAVVKSVVRGNFSRGACAHIEHVSHSMGRNPQNYDSFVSRHVAQLSISPISSYRYPFGNLRHHNPHPSSAWTKLVRRVRPYANWVAMHHRASAMRLFYRVVDRIISVAIPRNFLVNTNSPV